MRKAGKMVAAGFTGRAGRWWLGVLMVIGVAVAAGMAGMMTARADTPPGYEPAGPGDIYLALGDSLTTGTEEDKNNDGEPGYPTIISATLRTKYPDLAMHLLGKDGESSSTMISGGQLDAAVAYIADQRAIGKQVGLVTLSIGGNDMISILPQPLGESANGEAILRTFESNLATILDQLLAALEDDAGVRQGDLILMDYYNPYPGQPIPPPDGENLTDIWVPRFNTVITQTAAARGLPVANVHDRFAAAGEDEQLLFVDFDTMNYDYHPTLAGHEAIANRFIGASSYPLHRLCLPMVRR